MEYRFAERMRLVKPSAIRELLKLGADPEVISFGGGFPDPDIFPIEQLRKVYDSVLVNDGKKALQYTTSEGLPSLRQKLADRMKRAGVECGIKNVFMIQGAQQGLDITAKMFIEKGDVIITENPTFIGALIAFNPYEPKYVPVSMDDEGLRMDELEEALKANRNTKFIYTIPDFQNPTGITMSLARRKRIVELADEYDVMILEDVPYREIRYEGESLPSIKSFDTQGRVIQLGSFSKILSPGMRLGWVVAEPYLAEKLCLLKMAADTQNSTMNMYAADRFMEMYDIDEHIERIRKAYKAKKDLMLRTIRSEFPENVSFTDPQGGLFTWLTLQKDIDTTWLMKERTLPEVKVAYVPGASFYPVNEERNHCRINYSCMSDEKIVEGITKLGKILKEYC
ncbi:MAG TPA: PLP-dependent aminotransferase family protein [Bacillota bacterium]|nr:PLP-dependent aminotransferase family protein [Bacillota bacterium]HOG53019.1 PLP-dependent aminotransferase family protein [Bacillota bacterium]